MASCPITPGQIHGETMETVTNIIFLGLKITVDGDSSHEIKRCLLLGRKAMINLTSIQFSHSVVSDSSQPHGLQHARLPCPSPTPGACSNSCPWISDAIQPSHPLSSPFSPAFNLSQHQGLFQWVSSLHPVTQVLELRFSMIPSYEYSGLISFRMDWLDLLAVQGTLKSLLQHHSFFAFSFRYGPSLTSIYDYWKNHTFD